MNNSIEIGWGRMHMSSFSWVLPGGVKTHGSRFPTIVLCQKL